ncbi:MAG: sensor domain-containing protein [Mycobacterium sp.]
MTTARATRNVLVAVCVSVTAGGCSIFGGGSNESTTPDMSTATTNSATSVSRSITPSEANSLIVPTKDVGQLVGSTLDFERKSSNPGASSIDGKESCRALVAPLTIDIGDTWTTYRNVWYQESEDTFTHAVNQRVLLYPTQDQAASAFAKEFPPDIRACSGEVLKSDDTPWRQTVREVTPGRVQWAEEQILDSKPSGWRCINEARVVDNLLFAATVCQRGNGAPAVKAIIDRMAETAKPK